ncbi:MAG: hypothetical protein KDK36_11565, partial [Leptospiraceae bacterium]|nr:hypothetical protein [Leptospiraceae bacterium]
MRIYTSLLLFLALFLNNCVPYDDKISSWDAQSQLNAAVDFKAKECKTPSPQPPLYVFTDQEKRNLDLCTIAITRLTCPFNDYPIICLGIYIDSPTPDIPWYMNFNDLT